MIPPPPRLPRRHWIEDDDRPAHGGTLLFAGVVCIIIAIVLLLSGCGTLTSYELGAQAGRTTSELFRDGTFAWSANAKLHFDVPRR